MVGLATGLGIALPQTRMEGKLARGPSKTIVLSKRYIELPAIFLHNFMDMGFLFGLY